LFQPPYQWQNKGTYGHMGGIAHALQHSVASFVLLFPLFGISVAIVALIEGVIHYHIDWAKMNVNKHFGFKADTHEEFWWLLGADQLLHYLTYVGMIFYLSNS
jgi:hypothetical protein